jgi:ATP phosphoribosyltransferase regulatory subunit
MTDPLNKALLPAGLQDLLPPEAGREMEAVAGLLARFHGQGYERVKPPMLEFEDSLLSGPGAALAEQTFRLMDPVSQRMMGLRADMTPQVARLAGSRLANVPRPLRLCYAGQVLQVRGSQLRPERQFTQVGVEMIGADEEAADVEVILLAAEALQAIGVPGLSVDLNSPPLAASIATALGFDPALGAAIARALDGKDVAAVADLTGPNAPMFLSLLDAAGPAEDALRRLRDIGLPDAAATEVDRLERVVGLIGEALPELALTLDPVENRGLSGKRRGGLHGFLSIHGHGHARAASAAVGKAGLRTARHGKIATGRVAWPGVGDRLRPRARRRCRGPGGASRVYAPAERRRGERP